MSKHLPAFESAQVLVVGDVMLDRYWFGPALRISPEAPVPVVTINRSEECPGGAGNVALNLAALAVSTKLHGLVGDDTEAESLHEKLHQVDIQTKLTKINIKNTITKLRIISSQQQLIRLDKEELFTEDENKTVFETFKADLNNIGAIILSDYHKGTITAPQQFITLASTKNIPIFIDPKGCDFAPYRGATMLTPNRKEFENSVGECPTEQVFVERGMNAIKQHNLKALLITRGAEGVTLLQAGVAPFHLPAKAREVFDVTGAGDTVISVVAASVAAGAPFAEAVQLANTAAGIVVGKLGAAVVTPAELRQAVREEQGVRKILNEDQASVIMKDLKAGGEKIVFTNGCFDILHAGHVHYLQQAKALGHRLIVAVNDDLSVKKLKGEARPINSLEERMQVLAALGSVDWVVPFSEDTPERLISRLLPDVVVKGGDYQVDQVVGAKQVIDNVGVVKILDCDPGFSSSAVVEKI